MCFNFYSPEVGVKFVKYFNLGNLLGVLVSCLISLFLFDPLFYKKPFIIAIFFVFVLIYLNKKAFNKN